MSDATLTVWGGGGTWQVVVRPEETIIGRDPACDIVIDTMEVSRRHARLWRTASGQWALQDLGSTNGVYVNGRRTESCSLRPADVVKIGPAYLSLGPMSDAIIRATLPQRPKITVEDFGTEVLHDRPRLEECAGRPCPERLERLCQRLSGLMVPARIHVEVCWSLAWGPETAAAVFRIPPTGELTGKSLEVLAYHFGSNPEQRRTEETRRWYPSHRAFRVSHRLLEAIRVGGRPLMTKSIFSCDTQVTRALIDELSPRALLGAPLGLVEGATPLLYVDVPIDDRLVPGPEEMFAFVQAAAREVISAGSHRLDDH